MTLDFFWGLLAALGILSLGFFGYRLWQLSGKTGRELADMVDRQSGMLREQVNQIRRLQENVNRLASFQERLAEDAYSTIGAKTETRLDQLDAKMDAIIVSGGTEQSHVGTAGTSRVTECSQIVREIAHSLNTPLSRIEALALASVDERSGDEDEPIIMASLDDVLDAIQLCNSSIIAFRELTSVTAFSGSSQQSLTATLEAAARIYGSKMGVSIPVQVDLPDRIRGYSNSYIIALLLPLLENALEASMPDAPVEIRHSNADSFNALQVVGSPRELPDSMRIYEAGFTTKHGHEGLGLSTVERLVSAYSDASLSHECLNGKVVFTIQLPRRKP